MKPEEECKVNCALEAPLIAKEEEAAAIKSKSKGSSFSKDEIIEEVKKQLYLAGPLVSGNILVFLLQVISVMFVGHLGELALSGASMATSFASVTGFSLLRGLASALDTFCGQSYGAHQYEMLCVHTQRAMVILLLASIPLAFIWANAGAILLFLHQNPAISVEAGQYARYMIPGIFGFALLECHIKFLQTQRNVVPMMVTSGITLVVHIMSCWILVFKSGLGNKGAAVANAISCWFNALMLIVYVRISPSCKHTWTGFSMEAFRGLVDFLKLAIPSAIMSSLEAWSFEMMVLLSGLLPNPQLETSVLSIRCFDEVRFQMNDSNCVVNPIARSVTSVNNSTRVSNELGAGQPKAARRAMVVAVFIVATEGILVASIIILGRKSWSNLYSMEERVVEYVGEMLILVAVSHFFDGIQSVLSGAARGCGWQKIGAVVNLGAYYLLGIPCAVLLAFSFHLGGKGLWTGIIMALISQAFGLAVITLRTNRQTEAKRARDRVRS